jgi:hypothetical protein
VNLVDWRPRDENWCRHKPLQQSALASHLAPVLPAWHETSNSNDSETITKLITTRLLGKAHDFDRDIVLGSLCGGFTVGDLGIVDPD